VRKSDVSAPRFAYTLLEVALVLAIIVVMVALSYPSLEGMYATYRLQASADAIRARWAEARSQAVNEGRPYRFAVAWERGNYRFAPDSPEFWRGDESPGGDNPPGSFLIVKDSLPRGVRFTAGEAAGSSSPSAPDEMSVPTSDDAPSSWTNIVTFLPDGTASDDVEIVLQARSARPLVLRLRALTGTVSVRPQTSEGTGP
jgi:type II secretory pathway pseudopilin PulG